MNSSLTNDENKKLKIAGIGFHALIVISLTFFFFWLFNRTYTELTPFDTDEADHANAALELFTAISSFNLHSIYEAITRQAFYPPLYSIIMMPAYFILGPTLAANRVSTVVVFVIYTILLWAVTFKLIQRNKLFHNQHSQTALLFSLALLLAYSASSQITILNSILCMLELPGMLMVVLTSAAFLPLEKSEFIKPKNCLMIALAALAVFFTKYNFGIISIPAALSAIFLSPGFLKNFRSNFLNSLTTFTIIFAAIGGWVLLVDKRAFFHFFKGHNSYAPLLSSNNLFFELNSWISSYSVGYLSSSSLLLLSIVGGIAYWQSITVRFNCYNVLWAFFVLALSTTNEERHFMVAAPSLFILAALGIYRIFIFTLSRGVVLTTSALCFLVVPLFQGIGTEIKQIETKIATAFEGEPAYYDLQEFIFAHTDAKQPIIVNGVSDSFGIENLRWFLAANSGLPYTAVKVETFHFRDEKNFTAVRRKRNSDMPYRTSGFPKWPFQAVLDTGYYSYAVQIIDPARRLNKDAAKAAKQFSLALENIPNDSIEINGVKVVVYKLKE